MIDALVGALVVVGMVPAFFALLAWCAFWALAEPKGMVL